MVQEIAGAEDEQMFITGCLLLCDLKDFTMSHFTQMPISMIKKLTQCFEVFLKNDYCQNDSILFGRNLCSTGVCADAPKEHELH